MEKPLPGSRQRRHCVSFLTKSLKKIGKSVARKKPAAIANRVMSHPKIKKGILKVLGKLIVKEMKQVCQKKTSSMLRKTSAEALKSFSWDGPVSRIGKDCPSFLSDS